MMERENMEVQKYQIDYEYVMEKYADMVYRIAITITGSPEDARDAFQETFLRLVKNKDKIHDEEHLKAWLIRVVSNCSKSIITNPWNKHTQGLDETNVQAVTVENSDFLLQEIKNLPSNYAIPLYLFYYEDCSLKEIESILGKNVNTVKTLLRRGRNALKKRLEKGEFDYVR